MSNIYLVMFWDGYYDSSDHPVAIYTDKQVAIDYAVNYDLAHDELVTVEERCEGVQDCRQVTIVYGRRCYDHTQALSSMVFTYVDNLSLQEFVAVCVEQASPMLTKDVDFDRLYALYKEQFYDDEED